MSVQSAGQAELQGLHLSLVDLSLARGVRCHPHLAQLQGALSLEAAGQPALACGTCGTWTVLEARCPFRRPRLVATLFFCGTGD